MKIKVAVLRGGPSSAYDESLQTGGYILSLLRDSSDYEPMDVFVSRGGEWHYAGVPEEPKKILARADVAWNALQGEYGESGEAKRLLGSLRVPFVGSPTGAAALARQKDLAKELYRRHGIPTPASAVLSDKSRAEDELIEIFRLHPHPFLVKPVSGVRGVGIRLARSFLELREAVLKAFEHAPRVIVEEYVPGTVASVGIIEEAKGERFYALLPAHLETAYRRVRPRPEENRRMEEYARRAHEALGLRHYSAHDFIVTPRGKIYMLETNSQPLFYEDSLLHRSIEASGWKPYDFAAHCLNLALGK